MAITVKNVKNTQCRTWIIARKVKNVENDTYCRTWNMARKLTNEENEKLIW